MKYNKLRDSKPDKIRHVIRKRKRKPLCDYHGECKNLAYREVYPGLMGGKHKDKGWSYLCRKHFKQEQKRYKNKLCYTTLGN